MVEEGEKGGGEGLGEAAGSARGRGAAAAGRRRGEAGDTIPHHDGEKAVKAGGSRHVNDGVELGKVGIAVQMDDGGERLEGGRLDLHEMVASHLQQLHQLLQQAGVEQALQRVNF